MCVAFVSVRVCVCKRVCEYVLTTVHYLEVRGQTTLAFHFV